MKSNKFVYLIVVLVGLGVIYFLATSVIPKVLVSLTQASPARNVSLESSLIIGEKVMAQADGQDMIKVNVFVMDDEGKGIEGKVVELTGDLAGLPINSVSQSEGKAAFDVISTSKGQVRLGANIEGIELGKFVTVTFN